MSTSPAPSASRGEITLQPSYFTSSLYVEPLRQDIARLVDQFSQQYAQAPAHPFALFKQLWTELGWCWVHFNVFDGRARESFISVTERLFLERMVETEKPLARITCLFALYTFYLTQPSGSVPALHSVNHIAVPLDIYRTIVDLPSSLVEPHLLPLQTYAIFVLTKLIDAHAFHVLPHSEFRPYNPSVLPREIFVEDGQEATVFAALTADAAPSSALKKPPKRRGLKKAKDALVMLEKYVDKNALALPPNAWSVPSEDGAPVASSSDVGAPHITHTLAMHPPVVTLNRYREQKAHLLDALGGAEPVGGDVPGRQALERANHAVLARLRKIDELAAAQGLEVGGEGGEKTGLLRVERAVQELHRGDGGGGRRGGILGLLEGAGLDPGVDSDAVVGLARMDVETDSDTYAVPDGR
ncbi:hypothetical protein B0H21DRAFT_723363 [Amylocystis lapponica]|nr:hypothetical protein B0H21DRAFT_723363 [Amylocystis lapponica]